MKKCLAVASLASLALAAAPALAEEIVVFKNGQAMRVEKTRKDGKWLYLSVSADQEMGVLLKQVKGVEPAEPLPAGRDASVASNTVSGSGGGPGVGYAPPPVAESFEAGEGGEEVPAPLSPQEMQQQIQSQAPQGQDLTPPRTRRNGRGGGGRLPRTN